MQNYDYARRLNNRSSSFTRKKIRTSFLDSFFSNIFSKDKQDDISNSLFTIFIGAIFIFTAGLLVGLQLNNQQSNISNNELLSLKNISNEVEDKKQNQLLSPPKRGQINYLIKIYEDTDEDFLISIGQEIIDKYPSLSNKIFRSSKGELYVGYIYSKEESMDILKRIKKIEVINDIGINNIKTLQF